MDPGVKDIPLGKISISKRIDVVVKGKNGEVRISSIIERLELLRPQNRVGNKQPKGIGRSTTTFTREVI